MIWTRLFAAGLAVCAFVAPAVAQPATVTVESGALRGEIVDGVSRFLGVPYAAPPVGTLRWAPPRPAEAWSGVRDATTHAPSCMQAITPEGFGPWTKEYVAPPPVSEDCLHLNVWAPASKGSEARPVLVWIHGGAFMSGSNSVPIYDGAALAGQGIVVVAINYRLGVFGYAGFRELADDPQGSANFGLQDIIASLGWVRRNVRAFGGDPERITIAGQSAGAMAVHMLMVSPQARGLFSQAIAQSGIIETALPTLDDAWRRGEDLKTKAGVGTLSELRAVSAERIMAILSAGPLAGAADIGGVPLVGPVVDGRVLPDQVRALQVRGDLASVPVMVGLNADEGVLSPDYFRMSPQMFAAKVSRLAGPDKAALFLPEGGADTEAGATAGNKALTRLYGFASLVDWSRSAPAARDGRLFAYYFTHAEPGNAPDVFGAFHSVELPYVFDTLDVSPWRNFTDADREIARVMSAYWVNFVKTGNPNGEGVPSWPAYRRDTSTVMELGTHFAPYRTDAETLDIVLNRISGGLDRSIFGMAPEPGGVSDGLPEPGAR